MFGSKNSNISVLLEQPLSEAQVLSQLKVLSVRHGAGADTYRLEIEVDRSFAEMLAVIGGSFYPLYTKIAEERAGDQVRADRKSRLDARFALLELAGRKAFHLCRKSLPEDKDTCLRSVAGLYGLSPDAVSLSVGRYQKNFFAEVRRRRKVRVRRLWLEGAHEKEIAARIKVSVTTVYRDLAGVRGADL